MSKELFLVGRKGLLTTSSEYESVPILADSWQDAVSYFIRTRGVDRARISDLWCRSLGVPESAGKEG